MEVSESEPSRRNRIIISLTDEYCYIAAAAWFAFYILTALTNTWWKNFYISLIFMVRLIGI
jgi:hypothetical protein